MKHAKFKAARSLRKQLFKTMAFFCVAIYILKAALTETDAPLVSFSWYMDGVYCEFYESGCVYKKTFYGVWQLLRFFVFCSLNNTLNNIRNN